MDYVKQWSVNMEEWSLLPFLQFLQKFRQLKAESVLQKEHFWLARICMSVRYCRGDTACTSEDVNKRLQLGQWHSRWKLIWADKVRKRCRLLAVYKTVLSQSSFPLQIKLAKCSLWWANLATKMPEMKATKSFYNATVCISPDIYSVQRNCWHNWLQSSNPCKR